MRRKLFLAFSVAMPLLLAFTYNACSNKSGTFQFTGPSGNETITGNPLTPATNAFVNSVCTLVTDCHTGVTIDSCRTGLLALTGLGVQLGLPATLGGGAFSTVISAEQSGFVVPGASLNTCVSAISTLACSSTDAQNAFDPAAANPYAGVLTLVNDQTASCAAALAASSSAGLWTWAWGSNTINQKGVYVSPGVANASNVPGARADAAFTGGLPGGVWIYGGVGVDSTGGVGKYLSDLWFWNGTTWTWRGGSTIGATSAIFGTRNVQASSNSPGGKQLAILLTDSSGNLWLFGGYSYINNALGEGNDLWKFDVTTGTWVWVSGSNQANQPGVYGTQGVASGTNVPGAREGAVGFIDSQNRIWIFGGDGYDKNGTAVVELNDLWMFDPATNMWTWESGSSLGNVNGVYGVKGSAAAGNVPGSRQRAAGWMDSSGNIWIFGGVGFGASGSSAYLNDLWKFTPSTGLWTWESGLTAGNPAGVYGTQGIASTANAPGGRALARVFIDASGMVLLFGGRGYDSAGAALGFLNDLWLWDGSQWKWVSGSNLANQPGVYGTLGTASSTSMPGSRASSAVWSDTMGRIWIFGGNGFDTNGTSSYLNDLWSHHF